MWKIPNIEKYLSFLTITFVSRTADLNFCVFILKHFSAMTQFFAIVSIMIHNPPHLSALTNLVL